MREPCKWRGSISPEEHQARRLPQEAAVAKKNCRPLSLELPGPMTLVGMTGKSTKISTWEVEQLAHMVASRREARRGAANRKKDKKTRPGQFSWWSSAS